MSQATAVGVGPILRIFATLSALKRVINNPLSRSRQFLWTSAGITALFLMLGCFDRAKLVRNLSKIGRKVSDPQELDFEGYDVIICGGGTAGCVLASRLSEDPSISVLLLEAGTSGISLRNSRIPAAFSLLYHGRHIYDLRTVPQKFAGGTTKYWPRAKMLGGCSSINAQMAQYGSPADFDEWARIIGDNSWTYNEFNEYIRKFENFTHDPRYPLAKVVDRGSDGPVTIGYNSYMTRTAKDFVEACREVGIPFNPDFNTSTGTRGVNRIMTYIDRGGRRVSTESAYLTEAVLARPNLKVAINAQVTRVLFDTDSSGKRAIGVEYARSKTGPRYRSRARKEVVISGGAIHSPHILMLSGVGPAEHLKEHGIPIVHDLVGVGAHLIDHPSIDLRFKDKSESSLKVLRPATIMDQLRKTIATLQYFTTGKGMLSSNMADSAAFFRADDPVLFPPKEYTGHIEDSNSGPDSPDLEIITTPVAAKDHDKLMIPGLHTFGMHVVLLRPTSVGSLRLRSSDPWEDPSLNPNYCQTQHDVDVLLRGVKLGLKIAQTQPLAACLDETDEYPELDHKLHLKSDAELAEIVRERAETLYHPASTCRMAPLEEGGVVDSQLRVYGIPNLRVCDVSTFPSLVSGHPTGACIASAEKLADIMRAHIRPH